MPRPFNLGDECHYIFPDEINHQQQQHPLLRGLYVSRAGNFPRNHTFLTVRPNGFPNSHIIVYCTGGRGWFESQGQKWTIQAGDVLFVFADVPHAYSGFEDTPWQIQWAHFYGNETSEFLRLIAVTPSHPVVHIGNQFKIVDQFNAILQLCQLGYSPYVLIQTAATLRQILSSIALNRSFTPPNKKGLDVERTIQFMQENIAAPLTVKRLAAAANLSESHFSRLFQSKTGYAPLDYFIRLKMQRACERLYATDLNVGEIGRNLGYSDPFYFSRLFKKTVGVSPKQFRQQKTISIETSSALPTTSESMSPSGKQKHRSKSDALDNLQQI